MLGDSTSAVLTASSNGSPSCGNSTPFDSTDGLPPWKKLPPIWKGPRIVPTDPDYGNPWKDNIVPIEPTSPSFPWKTDPDYPPFTPPYKPDPYIPPYSPTDTDPVVPDRWPWQRPGKCPEDAEEDRWPEPIRPLVPFPSPAAPSRKRKTAAKYKYSLRFTAPLTDVELGALLEVFKKHPTALKWSKEGTEPSEELALSNIRLYAAIMHLLGHPSQLFRELAHKKADSVLESSLIEESGPTAAAASKVLRNTLYRALKDSPFHRQAFKLTPLDF